MSRIDALKAVQDAGYELDIDVRAGEVIVVGKGVERAAPYEPGKCPRAGILKAIAEIKKGS